jgi:hypothetical protein
MIIKNNNMLINEGRTKIPLFALNCGSIDMLT